MYVFQRDSFASRNRWGIATLLIRTLHIDTFRKHGAHQCTGMACSSSFDGICSTESVDARSSLDNLEEPLFAMKVHEVMQH